MKIESAVSIVWNNENLLIDAESGWHFTKKFCGCWEGWSTFNFEGKNAKKGKGA